MTDTNFLVSMPSAPFSSPRAFKAVSNGKIYIGLPDTDPVNPVNQVPVYVVNEDGSEVQVAQPIIINAGGFPVYNGQIVKFVVKQPYSMAVYDMYAAQQYYWPDLTLVDPANLIAMLAATTGASMIGGLSFISPEMYGAKGDGVTDDTAAIQAAIDAAKSSSQFRVEGKGRYRIFSPVKLDNLGQGFRLDLQAVIADASFPATSDWKTANGMFEVGGSSNGSMVGVEIKIGFASGNNVATLFKLKGYGAGGSSFWAGRVQDCIGVFDSTNSNQANSNSNLVEGLYWLRGTYGIRLRRNGSFVVEGTKIRVGFMTGMKYGGIQMFNGAQEFSINATGIDFCGRNLTQLTVNALPPVTVRETMLTNNATGNSFEVLDVYQQFSGVYSILVIEPSSSEGGSDQLLGRPNCNSWRSFLHN